MSFDLTSKNIKDTFQNLLQKTGSEGKLYDLKGNEITDLTIGGTLTAHSYVTSESIVSTSSGSTAFGNDDSDSHKFIGNITASGQISSSNSIAGTRGVFPVMVVTPKIQSADTDTVTINDNLNINNNLNTDGQVTASEDLYVLGNARLGSHQSKLHTIIGGTTFEGNITASGDISASGDLYIDKIQGSTTLEELNDGGDVSFIIRNTAGGGSTDETATLKFSHVTSAAGGKIVSGRDGTYTVGAASDSNLQIYTALNGSDTEKMRIDSDGNVGIGTTAPTKKLTVEGDISASGEFIGSSVSSTHITASGDVNANRFLVNGTRYLEGSSDELTLGFGVGGGKIIIGRSNATPSIFTNGHITASGIISSSGDYITATRYDIGEAGKFASQNFEDNFYIGNGGIGDLTLNQITASGNISSSGDLISTDLFIDTSITHNGDTDTKIAFSDNSVRVNAGNVVNTNFYSYGTEFLLPITASGNISASDILLAEGNLVVHGTNVLDNFDKGNISASGDFEARWATLDRVYIRNHNDSTESTRLTYDGSNLTNNSGFSAAGHISASGNISASGLENVIPRIYGDAITGINTTNINLINNRIDFAPNNVIVMRLGDDIVTLNKDTKIVGHLTASGNISMSSNGTFTGYFPDTNDDAAHYPIVVDGQRGTLESQNSLNINPSTNEVTVGKLNVNGGGVQQTGHITASGNISSSGTIIANEFQIDGANFGTRHVSGLIYIANSSDKVEVDGTNIKLDAPVTASGDISASGNLSVTGDLDLDGTSLFAGSIGVNGSPADSVQGVNVSGYVSASGGLVVPSITNAGGTFTYSVDQDGGDVGIIIRNTNVDTGTDKTTSLQFGHARGVNNEEAGKIVSGKEASYSTTGNSDSFMAFYTTLDGDDTEYMRITSDGNIGIGTTTPPEKLTVEGSISASGNIIQAGNGTEPFLSASNGTLQISGSGDGYLEVVGNISASGNLQVDSTIHTDSHITASGQISSSGTGNNYFGGPINTKHIVSIGSNLQLTDGATLASPRSVVTVNGDLTTTSHITASGNISASGAYIGSRTFETGSNVIGAEGKHSGADIVYFGAGSLTAGKCYYLATNGTWTPTNATDNSAGADELLGIALGSSATTNGVLLRGIVKVHSDSSVSNNGRACYLSDGDSELNDSAPSSNNNIVRIVGYVIDSSNDTIYFNPSAVWVKIST